MYYDCDYHIHSQCNLTTYDLEAKYYQLKHQYHIVVINHMVHTQAIKITNDRSCVTCVPVMFTYSYCFLFVTKLWYFVFMYISPHSPQ